MYKIHKKILIILFGLLVPSLVSASNLNLVSNSSTFEVGKSFTIQVNVSGNVPFNAVSSSIQVDPTILTIESVSKIGSLVGFWAVEPNFSNSTGQVNFEGVIIGTSQIISGNILSIRLRPVKSGITRISFKSGQILANDGSGTDIVESLNSLGLNISESTYVEPVKKQVIPEPVSEPVEVVKNIEKLAPPQISYGKKFGNPAIIGVSKQKNKNIILLFTSRNGTRVFISGITESNGDFSLLVPDSLKYGEYNVYGYLVNDNGESSNSSNSLTINVGNLVSDISYEIYIVLSLLMLIIVYLIWQNHCESLHISKSYKTSDIDDVSKIIHKTFKIFKEDINNKDIHLLEKDIISAEKVIDSKIKKI